MRDLFFINWSLGFSYGGRFRSIFSRALLFDKTPGYSATILTMDFRPDYAAVYASARKRQQLPETVRFDNLYSFLAQEDIYGRENKPRLVRTDVTPARPDGTVLVDEYYTPAGRLFLVRQYDCEGKETRCAWIDGHAATTEFDYLGTAQQYWISCLAAESSNPFFLIEHRNYDGIVTNNAFNPNLASIATIHGNHYQPPFRPGAALFDYIEPLFQHLNDYSALVFLTHRQKHHVFEEFGHRSNAFVIRHPYDVPARSPHVVKREKTLVLLASFYPEKRIDHAIRAMSLAVKHDSAIKLEIYGTAIEDGSHEFAEGLEELADSLHLGDNVAFKGYTPHTHEVLESASASLVTSAKEGLCLSVLESLSAGTPVVAYDIDYGPAEMIRDGVNGRLVQDGDIEALAQAIVELMSNEALLETMSQNAVRIPPDFSDAAILQEWESLFDFVENLSPEIKRRDAQASIMATSPLRCQAALDGDSVEITLDIEAHVAFIRACTPQFYLQHTDAALLNAYEHISTQGYIQSRHSDTTSSAATAEPLEVVTIQFRFSLPRKQMRDCLESEKPLALLMCNGTCTARYTFTEAFRSACMNSIAHNMDNPDNRMEWERFIGAQCPRPHAESTPPAGTDALPLHDAAEALEETSIEVGSVSPQKKAYVLQGNLTTESAYGLMLGAELVIGIGEDEELAFPLVFGESVGAPLCTTEWTCTLSLDALRPFVKARTRKRQYWKVDARLSAGGRTRMVTKGFKEVGAVKLGALCVFSYFGKKTLG